MRSTSDLSNDLDFKDKELKEAEQALNTVQDEILALGKKILGIRAEISDLTLAENKAKYNVRCLTREFNSIKRQFFQAKNSGL